MVLAAGSTVALAAGGGTVGGRTATCAAPGPPGSVIDVGLTDMGARMGSTLRSTTR